MVMFAPLDALSCQVRTDALTPRESEVVAMVAQGATNRQVSRKLWLSEKTIEKHLTNVYRKLGVHSRCQLALLYPAAAACEVRDRCDDDQG